MNTRLFFRGRMSFLLPNQQCQKEKIESDGRVHVSCVCVDNQTSRTWRKTLYVCSTPERCVCLLCRRYGDSLLPESLAATTSCQYCMSVTVFIDQLCVSQCLLHLTLHPVGIWRHLNVASITSIPRTSSHINSLRSHESCGTGSCRTYEVDAETLVYWVSKIW